MSEPAPELRRNIAFARVWSVQAEAVLPAELAEDLTDRGFVPGVSDVAVTSAPMNEAGLGLARFEVGGEPLRFLSLSSSRGDGCTIAVRAASDADPVPPRAQAAVRRPRLVYVIEASGPAHSDRNLCENLAEALLVRTGGLAEVGGRGVKGNRPELYQSRWIGKIKR